MRNWKNLRPNTSAHGVRSTGSAVRLRLLSRAIIGIFVLSGVSCKSAKTVTETSIAAELADSQAVSAVHGVSLRSAGGTPSTGTARIRVMVEPSPTPDISSPSPATSPSPALPRREGAYFGQPLLVIEAEADGSGGTAPEVEASSSTEAQLTSSGRTAASNRAKTREKPPNLGLYVMGFMGLIGITIMGLLGFVGFILKKHLNNN